MKIYKLTINKVEPDPFHVITSQHKNSRTLISELFYLSKEKAQLVASLKYEAAIALYGIRHDLECIVTEIDVVE